LAEAGFANAHQILAREGRETVHAFWDLQPGFTMPAGVIENKDTMVRHIPAPASRANASSSASKNRFDTPLEMYQKVSPVAGETKAVSNEAFAIPSTIFWIVVAFALS
ncbi:MAG: hypothetical protein WBX25_07095, partial [Rhodomicrobium sp.]